MSYHIVHILTHGSCLNIDRGCLVCKIPNQNETCFNEKRIPKQDVAVIIIAARGVSFSSNCLSSLIENGCVVLHCDEKYKPIGKTIGLSTIVHNNIFERQVSLSKDFNDKLWDKILYSKIENQSFLLDYYKVEHNLWQVLKENNFDEGNIARAYWSYYFPLFDDKNPDTREHRDAKKPVNQLLNYGYAVLGAILHRSLIAHGLNTSLGIHHKYRFKSEPLLYDLVEPLRPFCDYMLVDFFVNGNKLKIDLWAKYVAQKLVDTKIKLEQNKSLKFLYVIDFYASSIANCFNEGNLENIFIPSINNLKCD